MNTRFLEIITGMRESMQECMGRIEACSLNLDVMNHMADIIQEFMHAYGFDSVRQDGEDNVIGIVNGLKKEDSIVIISKLDFLSIQRAVENYAYPSGQVEDGYTRYCAGLVTNMVTGGLIKRAMVPLKGDVIHCFIPKVDGYGYGIKHLFSELLSEYGGRIKGVILVEPTNLNIFLGNKGHCEYEIFVKGRMKMDSMQRQGLSMLGTMFPLVNELEKVSHMLPTNARVGSSRLRIKDIHYTGDSIYDDQKEFNVVVDRLFVPEESEEGILSNALHIANTIYQRDDSNAFEIATSLATKKVRTRNGLEYTTVKEIKPWIMESHHPFVLNALSALRDNKVSVETGYWKELSTYGGYTHTDLQIPTIGIGPGTERSIARNEEISLSAISEATMRIGHIIRRIIGMPTFGWSDDEI